MKQHIQINNRDSKLFTMRSEKYKNTESHVFSFLFIVLIFVFFSSAHAATITESPAKDTQKQTNTESKEAQKGIKIRGNTLVIEDASCLPHNQTLLSSLHGDSVKKTSQKDCDEEHK